MTQANAVANEAIPTRQSTAAPFGQGERRSSGSSAAMTSAVSERAAMTNSTSVRRTNSLLEYRLPTNSIAMQHHAPAKRNIGRPLLRAPNEIAPNSRSTRQTQSAKTTCSSVISMGSGIIVSDH